MVTSIAVYVEGGGPTSATKDPFRRGFSTFLAPLVQQMKKRSIRWRLVVCGGRQEAYDKFRDALRTEPGVLNLLLVDSEEPVAITVGPWNHLKVRVGDFWKKPSGAKDMHCQMMVACMEGWFLADPDALKKHFGGNFDVTKLPPANQAETRTKSIIADALRQATVSTKAKKYEKIRDGARLLEKVDPTVVRRHCKWCDRLFVTVATAMETTV